MKQQKLNENQKSKKKEIKKGNSQQRQELITLNEKWVWVDKINLPTLDIKLENGQVLSQLIQKDNLTIPPVLLTEGMKQYTNIAQLDSYWLQWFVGFFDGEGFLYFKPYKETDTKIYMQQTVQISIHKDDGLLIHTIKEKLNIGSIGYDQNKIRWQVRSLEEIVQVIIPIFDAYPFLTRKYLNYQLFKKACMIKYNNARGTSLSHKDYNILIELHNQMNTKLDKELEKQWNISNLNTIPSLGWIVGFIEAEGSFGIKGDCPFFQITQTESSDSTLDIISSFFTRIAFNNAKDHPILSTFKSFFTNFSTQSKLDRTPVKTYRSTILDFFYYIIIPFFSLLPMHSRKRIDFKLWAIAVILMKRGFHLEIEGKILIRKIANSMNDRRYTTHILSEQEKLIGMVSFEEIQAMLETKSLIDISNNGHAAAVSRAFGSNSGKVVYIYTSKFSDPIELSSLFQNPKNLIQIEGSPFLSYRSAASALSKLIGRGVGHKTISSYIDKPALYKNKFIIKSTSFNISHIVTIPIK